MSRDWNSTSAFAIRPEISQTASLLKGGRIMVVCCDEMSNAMTREMIVHTERYMIQDGRSYNDIDSEYFLRSADSGSARVTYLALNFCPFCGRPLARALWNAEKKK